MGATDTGDHAGFHCSGRHPDVGSDCFKHHGYDVVVDNAEGYLCKIRCKSLVDLPCSEVHKIFSNPDNSAVFRTVDSVLCHRVLAQCSLRKCVYVEQSASVGLLWFRKQFTTALHVTHHHDEMKTTFELAPDGPPGVMASFQGFWELSPVAAADFGELAQHNSHLGSEPHAKEACMMYLEQDVGPRVAGHVPPMFHGILRRAAKGAVLSLIQDVSTVADLRKAGIPLDTILKTRVHGRGGLKAQYLNKKPMHPPGIVDGASASMDGASGGMLMSHKISTEFTSDFEDN